MQYALVGLGLGYQAFDQVIRFLTLSVRRVKLDVQQRDRRTVDFYLRYGFQIVLEEERWAAERRCMIIWSLFPPMNV
mgnify:CR=1 FL=1